VRPGSPTRGIAFRGTVWEGGAATAYQGVVVVDGAGRIAAMGPQIALPDGLPVFGDEGCWVGPGLVDAHVHLAFGGPAEALPGGVVAVRDLGAPLAEALGWQAGGGPAAGSAYVSVAGPVLTAPGGYPSTSWGAGGFAAFLADAGRAASVVGQLAADGVDLIKVALEPAGGAPVLSPAVLRAVVEAAHRSGLAVTAHALTVDMVRRAVDAGVNELAHTPVEPLPEELVESIASAGISVVSTLQCFFAGGGDGGDGGAGHRAVANAAALHRAGVRLVYGTDLGNAGTRTGAEPRELERLADAGLGRLGALRAATEGSAQACGLPKGGRLMVGQPAALVLLGADPLVEPEVWRAPRAVYAGGRLITT